MQSPRQQVNKLLAAVTRAIKMVTLGGVALGYDIIWTDRHQSDGVY